MQNETLPPLSPTPPGLYRHYKGKLYEVLDTVRHSETLEPMTLYRALYGAQGLWVRPAAMFGEAVVVVGTSPQGGWVQVCPLQRRGPTVDLEYLASMKPYLMTLAAFVCISFLLLGPKVYAQFSGAGMGGGPGAGMGGGRPGERGKGCEGGEKPGADRGPMGQPPETMGRRRTCA